MAVDKSQVVDIAPEFKNEDEARINRFIERASLLVNAAKWGDKTDLGIALMTAHLLSLTTMKGKGPATSEKVGDLARTYAAGSTEDLGMTSYGQEFLRIRKTLLITPMVTS